MFCSNELIPFTTNPDRCIQTIMKVSSKPHVKLCTHHSYSLKGYKHRKYFNVCFFNLSLGVDRSMKFGKAMGRLITPLNI